MPPPPDQDWDARTYHCVSSPQYAWGLGVLARLPLQGSETVLDAGCGTGRLTQELLTRLPHGRVIAVDLSETMLRKAEETLGKDPRVELHRRDLSRLDLDTPVDAIFSTATFHWVLDHDALFRCLFRTLNPGGLLVAQCGGGPNLARVHARAEALATSARFQEHFGAWKEPWLFADREATVHRLEREGFDDIRVTLEAAPTPFDGPEPLRRFLKTVVLRPHLERLPTLDLQSEFLDAMVSASAADDPPWVLDYWRLNIDARRPPR